MKFKKAQLGLNTVKAVMIAFLVISVIGVAIILTLTSVRNVAEDIDTNSVSITNITTDSVVNETGAYVSGTSTLLNCVLSVTGAINQTDSVIISSGNYTTSGCKIVYAGAGDYNNTVWNITGSYVYSGSNSRNIQSNVSSGVTGFFSNTGTIFSILVVVVIILAIAIIIAVVSRFGGEGITGSSASKGPKTVSGL